MSAIYSLKLLVLIFWGVAVGLCSFNNKTWGLRLGSRDRVAGGRTGFWDGETIKRV